MLVQERCRTLVLGRVVLGDDALAVMDAADRGAGHKRAQDIDAGTMGEVDMVDRLEVRVAIGDAGGTPVHGVSEEREDGEFVEGGKALDAVAVAPCRQCRVIGEPAGTVAARPAAQIVERLRQVPVIKAEPRLDPRGQERIDEPVVERQARFVRGPASERQNPRPGEREAVGGGAELLHQRHVVEVEVIVVAGDVAGIAVGNAALLAATRVPDARAAAILERRPFDLIARGGDPPDEVGRPAGGIVLGWPGHRLHFACFGLPSECGKVLCETALEALIQVNGPEAPSQSAPAGGAK